MIRRDISQKKIDGLRVCEDVLNSTHLESTNQTPVRHYRSPGGLVLSGRQREQILVRGPEKVKSLILPLLK